jgi:hypothetical protein
LRAGVFGIEIFVFRFLLDESGGGDSIPESRRGKWEVSEKLPRRIEWGERRMI